MQRRPEGMEKNVKSDVLVRVQAANQELSGDTHFLPFDTNKGKLQASMGQSETREIYM